VIFFCFHFIFIIIRNWQNSQPKVKWTISVASSLIL
jgi:hypothetical protein